MHKRLNKELLIVLFLLSVSTAVRLVYILQSSSNPSFTAPTVDSGTYDQIARRLANGEGMNDQFFWQPFFYPVFLSMVYFFSGSSIAIAKVVQAILGGTTCVLTYVLGKKVFNRRAGLLAGIITSLYGPLIFFETELLGAGWAAFWSVALILLFLRTASEKKPWLWMLLGLCGGLGILTRPTFVPFFAAGCLWLLITFHRENSHIRELVIRFIGLAAGFLLVTTPVAFQNHRITGRFGIMPATGGLNFYIGNNPNYIETITIRPGWGWGELTTLPQRNGVTGDLWAKQRYFYERFTNFVKTEPLQYAKGLVYKTVQFINSRELPRNDDLYVFGKWSSLLRTLTWKKGGFGFPFGALLPLVFFGLIYYWKKISTIVKLFIVFHPLSIILVFVCARYRVIEVPIMAVLAAAGLFGLVEMVKQSRWVCIGIAVICGAGLILLSSIPGPFPEEKINYEAELYGSVADTKILRGEYEQAINYLKKSLRMEPDDGMAYASLATALLHQGDTEQAIKYYQEALRFKPDAPEVLNSLGVAMNSLGKFDEAIKYYRRSIEINPRNVLTHVNLGNNLLRKGDYEAAIESYTQAIAINPNLAMTYLNRGQVYYQLGQFSLAEKDYRKVLQIDPRDADNHILLAKSLARQGKYDEAVSVLKKAIGFMARLGDKKAADKLQTAIVDIESWAGPVKEQQ